MNVKTIVVGYLQTNCYIIEKNNNCLIIDPGDDFQSIVSQVGNKHVLAVLVTHYHDDHIGALKQIKDHYNVQIIDNSNTEEKEYKIANFDFKVIKTPGHTSDSITFYFYQYQLMFVGDFIFKNTIGRTDLETGSMEEMKKSIKKIKEYPEMVRIYPGHGEYTILNHEKEHNSFFN